MTICFYCKHYKGYPEKRCGLAYPTKLRNWELESFFKDCCSFEKADEF